VVGINKFTEKERRKARRSFQHDHIKADFRTPKYMQRVIPHKNKADRFYEEEIEYHENDE
jgi:hypothetical protein